MAKNSSLKSMCFLEGVTFFLIAHLGYENQIKSILIGDTLFSKSVINIMRARSLSVRFDIRYDGDESMMGLL